MIIPKSPNKANGSIQLIWPDNQVPRDGRTQAWLLRREPGSRSKGLSIPLPAENIVFSFHFPAWFTSRSKLKQSKVKSLRSERPVLKRTTAVHPMWPSELRLQGWLLQVRFEQSELSASLGRNRLWNWQLYPAYSNRPKLPRMRNIRPSALYIPIIII